MCLEDNNIGDTCLFDIMLEIKLAGTFMVIAITSVVFTFSEILFLW